MTRRPYEGPRVDLEALGKRVLPPPRLAGYAASAWRDVAGGEPTKWASSRTDFAKLLPGANYIASFNYGVGMTQLERGSARALVYTSSAAPGSYIEYGPYSRVTKWNADIAALWEAAIELVMKRYATIANPSFIKKTIEAFAAAPTGRHKGYPDHTSGRDPRAILAHVSIADAVCSGDTTLPELNARMAESFGEFAYYSQFIRIQPSARWIKNFTFADNGWAAPAFEAQFEDPRPRSVFAPPYYINLILRKGAGFMKGLTRATRWHALEPDAIKAQVERIYEVVDADPSLLIDSMDQKEFDRHNHNELQRLLFRAVGRWAEKLGHMTSLDRRSWDDACDWAIEAKVLTPPVHQDMMMFLREKDDCLGSGLSMTSGYGSLILASLVVILNAHWTTGETDVRELLKLLPSSDEQITLGMIEMLISGDDITVTRPRSRPPSKWPDVGFESESIEDFFVFLSKQRLRNGETRAILGNHYAKKVAPERSDIDRPEALDLVAMAATLESASTSLHPEALDEALRATDYGRKLVGKTRTLRPDDIQNLVKVAAAAGASMYWFEKLDDALEGTATKSALILAATNAVKLHLRHSGEKQSMSAILKAAGGRMSIADAITNLYELRNRRLS